MKINYKIVSGILAAGWAYEAYANCSNAKRAYSARKKLASLINYQAGMLDKHKVPMTEFDLIAMKQLVS